MSVITVTSESHRLEIYGPRNQGWRPVDSYEYREASSLAREGSIEKALSMAEETRIKEHGHMRGVAFRVATNRTSYSSHLHASHDLSAVSEDE